MSRRVKQVKTAHIYHLSGRNKGIFGFGVDFYAAYVFVYFRYGFCCFSFTVNRNILMKLTGETGGGLQ